MVLLSLFFSKCRPVHMSVSIIKLLIQLNTVNIALASDPFDLITVLGTQSNQKDLCAHFYPATTSKFSFEITF